MLRVAVPAIWNQERGNVKDIFSSNRGRGGGEARVHLIFFKSAREILKTI